jgi:hypothetical protein
MRNYDPTSEYDRDDAKRMGAKPWQLELLALNPDYCSWGPHEDYMIQREGGDQGWGGNQFYDSWKDFGPWGVDDLNVCANFYFSVERDSKECPTCGGNGYHPDAQEVVNTFYRHQNARGISWSDKITQDELDVLIAEGRIKEGASLADVNAANSYSRRPGSGFGHSHDAINRCILIEQRLKRLGLPKTCPACEGTGHVYTAPEPHVTLTLWWLHPRKGAQRAIEVKNIQQADLNDVYAFLTKAREQNDQRFSKIPR